MENPSQSHYTTEELFLLKPEITEVVAKNPEIPGAPAAANTEIANTRVKPIKKAFWSNYKWYVIVGGVLVIAGVGWYIHNENKKKKKTEPKK